MKNRPVDGIAGAGCVVIPHCERCLRGPWEYFLSAHCTRMVDSLTREHRSKLMSKVRQKNTPAELAVRNALYSMGFRYRLHRKDLPGRPDIVLPRSKKAIFVHGCFWHRHDCKKATTPKSNNDYWTKKFAENVERDKRVIAELTSLGWDTMIVWECETRDVDALANSLSTFLKQ